MLHRTVLLPSFSTLRANNSTPQREREKERKQKEGSAQLNVIVHRLYILLITLRPRYAGNDAAQRIAPVVLATATLAAFAWVCSMYVNILESRVRQRKQNLRSVKMIEQFLTNTSIPKTAQGETR